VGVWMYSREGKEVGTAGKPKPTSTLMGNYAVFWLLQPPQPRRHLLQRSSPPHEVSISNEVKHQVEYRITQSALK
jgi:hypothetical protein